jgi:DNA transformation protein
METALIDAGIANAETLREVGANAAYCNLLENGQRPHFIEYYVMHMALQGRPWNG